MVNFNLVMKDEVLLSWEILDYSYFFHFGNDFVQNLCILHLPKCCRHSSFSVQVMQMLVWLFQGQVTLLKKRLLRISLSINCLSVLK